MIVGTPERISSLGRVVISPARMPLGRPNSPAPCTQPADRTWPGRSIESGAAERRPTSSRARPALDRLCFAVAEPTRDTRRPRP